MDTDNLTDWAQEHLGFLRDLDFQMVVDSKARVRFESKRIQVVLVADGGEFALHIAQKTSAGPHSPTYSLAEILRWCGMGDRPVPCDFKSDLALAAAQIRQHALRLLNGDEDAFDELGALRAQAGPIVSAKQRKRI